MAVRRKLLHSEMWQLLLEGKVFINGAVVGGDIVFEWLLLCMNSFHPFHDQGSLLSLWRDLDLP